MKLRSGFVSNSSSSSFAIVWKVWPGVEEPAISVEEAVKNIFDCEELGLGLR